MSDVSFNDEESIMNTNFWYKYFYRDLHEPAIDRDLKAHGQQPSGIY
jgi:hypothetical protein